MSISSKLLQVNQVKQDIKDAIEDKGIDMTDTTFTDYADKIDIIPVQKEEEEKTVSTTSFASGNIVVEPTTNKVMTKVTINKDTTNHIGENIKDGITLYGIQGSLLPAKEEETKTISNPNFSAGDVVVTPDTNKVLSKATVKKDANLVAGNIKDGVTLFGVTGNIATAKVEQEKTVSNPNFSAGDVVVTPDANKVLSKATVKKDANLVAGNIKDGVTLFGVTGDYEGEGGGAPIGYNVTFNYFDDLSGRDYITIYAVVNGVAQNYTFVNRDGVNLNLTNVTYITAFINEYSGPEELPFMNPYDTIIGATTAQLVNGLIPTQNISFSYYRKD